MWLYSAYVIIKLCNKSKNHNISPIMTFLFALWPAVKNFFIFELAQKMFNLTDSHYGTKCKSCTKNVSC